jgi:branched-chain amino acid transport system ATP-binding protein
MLEIRDATVTRLGKTVADGVSMTIRPACITAVLGANGAGKSELVLGVAGLLPVTGGQILLDDRAVTNLAPNLIRAAGICAVPEGHQVLTDLSVEDNLLVAASLLKPDAARRKLAAVWKTFPELAERAGQKAGTMSGGQQQMLAIGHALMARPRFMLIDEMSMGLAPLIVKRLMGVLQELAGRGIGILLVEQFAEVALALADDVIVLRRGRVVLEARAQELRAAPDRLVRAYL